jgi:hypothetical protein
MVWPLGCVRHAFVAALGHEVGRADLTGELLPRFAPAHHGNALGAHLLCGQHAEETDCAVTNYRDRLAGANRSRVGGEPAGAEHIRCGKQTRDQVIGGDVGCGDQCAVRERDTQQRRLRALRANGQPVYAPALVPCLTKRAGAVRGEERADDELAALDALDLAADLLDDADVLVANRDWPSDRSTPR